MSEKRFIEGQEVLVRDFQGQQFRRVVWKDEGAFVFVTSERVLNELRSGYSRLFAIPIQRPDVEAVDMPTQRSARIDNLEALARLAR